MRDQPRPKGLLCANQPRRTPVRAAPSVCCLYKGGSLPCPPATASPLGIYCNRDLHLGLQHHYASSYRVSLSLSGPMSDASRRALAGQTGRQTWIPCNAFTRDAGNPGSSPLSGQTRTPVGPNKGPQCQLTASSEGMEWTGQNPQQGNLPAGPGVRSFHFDKSLPLVQSAGQPSLTATGGAWFWLQRCWVRSRPTPLKTAPYLHPGNPAQDQVPALQTASGTAHLCETGAGCT